MFEKDEKIENYRVRQYEHYVVIDEQKGFFFSTLDILFGLIFLFPLALFVGALFPDGFLGVKWESPDVHYPILGWLIFIPFLCIPFVLGYFGIAIAFSRLCVIATNDNIFIGTKWFNLWQRTKATQISEIDSIKLGWTRRGPFSGRRVCGVFIILTKTGKLVNLVTCVEHGDALKLANMILSKTNLSLQDMASS
jgi:hypothetical protein